MNKYRPFAALAACLLASHVSANTFTVINTNETGSGSLPSAIGNCNNNPGDDVVTFDIPGNG
ncbi:MAG: hypothetical protein ACJ8EL_02890 [Rhizomicrobium sp.]